MEADVQSIIKFFSTMSNKHIILFSLGRSAQPSGRGPTGDGIDGKRWLFWMED